MDVAASIPTLMLLCISMQRTKHVNHVSAGLSLVPELKASQMLEEQRPLRDVGHKLSLRSETQRLIIITLMAQNGCFED